MSVRVIPVQPADLTEVAAFLHDHLNARLSARDWATTATVPWQVAAPNHGFMLLDDRRPSPIVGVYLAFYSTRLIDGVPENFCNLAGWSVLAEYRFHAVPNLPWPYPPGRARISCDPDEIERTLTGVQLAYYRDHQHTRAARHLVLTVGDQWCYVIFRRDRPRNLPLFASLIHVSDPALFRRLFRLFCAHLLIRHRIPFTLVEPRAAGHRPRASVPIRSPRRKMYLSDTLQPHQIDYLYSELACVPTAA
jgi:hypothetical protein